MCGFFSVKVREKIDANTSFCSEIDIFQFLVEIFVDLFIFVIRRFHSHNVLGIRQFADSLGCSQLVTEAESYIHSNFTKVSSSDEFLNLSEFFFVQLRIPESIHIFTFEF